MKTILITGADRGVGLGMTTVFLEAGWRVFAGQYMPRATHRGILIHCT